jgi:hypothetical protein
MNLENIYDVLNNPNESTIEKLLNDNNTVFLVDWREDDELIPGYCEKILKTGFLQKEVIKINDAIEFYVIYKDRKVLVPLTFSLSDRHITLYSLNNILAPDYEIRLCKDSLTDDTLVFLPLECKIWNLLETDYGLPCVERIFYRLKESPDVFVDDMSPKISWKDIADVKEQYLAAIKMYKEEYGVGISEAKKVIDEYLKNKK